MCLAGGGQPSGPSSSKALQGQHKDQDVQHGEFAASSTDTA